MGWGIRQWSLDNGGLILDTQTEFVSRIFDVKTIDAGAGSFTDSRFSAGTPFYSRIATTPTFTQDKPKTFSFSGTTLNWSAGPACTIMYGIGKGSSSYNPVTNGTRPGFQCRTEDGSLVTLDESFFGLHLIGKGTKTLSNGSNSFTVSTPDGKLPLIAFRSSNDAYIYVDQITGAGSGTATVNLGPPNSNTTVEWYAFGTVYPGLSRGMGARWYDPSTNVLMGDTSVPLLKPVLVDQRHFIYPWTNKTTFIPPSAYSGRKLAVILNDPGFGIYKPPSTMGQNSITGYKVGVRTYANGNFEAGAVQTFSVQAGGTNEILDYTDGYLSIIDVTNF